MGDAFWELQYLMEVRGQRSGGCEAAAGTGPLPRTAAGWALGFGPGLPAEEWDAPVLASKNKQRHNKQTPSEIRYTHKREQQLYCVFFFDTLGLSLTDSGGIAVVGQVFTSSP